MKACHSWGKDRPGRLDPQVHDRADEDVYADFLAAGPVDPGVHGVVTARVVEHDVLPGVDLLGVDPPSTLSL